jgi:hypothetical protein
MTLVKFTQSIPQAYRCFDFSKVFSAKFIDKKINLCFINIHYSLDLTIFIDPHAAQAGKDAIWTVDSTCRA